MDDYNVESKIVEINGIETYILYIPLFIPKELVDNQIIEKMVNKKADWTPTVQVEKVENGQTVLNEAGQPIIETVPNPLSAEEAGRKWVRSFVLDEARSIVFQEGAQKGGELEVQKFNSIFNSLFN